MKNLNVLITHLCYNKLTRTVKKNLCLFDSAVLSSDKSFFKLSFLASSFLNFKRYESTNLV